MNIPQLDSCDWESEIDDTLTYVPAGRHLRGDLMKDIRHDCTVSGRDEATLLSRRDSILVIHVALFCFDIDQNYHT